MRIGTGINSHVLSRILLETKTVELLPFALRTEASKIEQGVEVEFRGFEFFLRKFEAVFGIIENLSRTRDICRLVKMEQTRQNYGG